MQCKNLLTLVFALGIGANDVRAKNSITIAVPGRRRAGGGRDRPHHIGTRIRVVLNEIDCEPDEISEVNLVRQQQGVLVDFIDVGELEYLVGSSRCSSPEAVAL